MGVYIVGFLLSILLIYYAETKGYSGLPAKICAWFALLVPCLIAGLRDETIGTDVRGYVQTLFEIAQQTDSVAEYFTNIYSGYDIEVGFALLVYVVHKFFGNMNMVLFFIQALTVIPVYKGLRAMDKTYPVWLGMAVYYLMFFNQTLNMMRQWIAMAILFYAFQFLISKNYRKYFLLMGTAMLFHVSAILGCLIFAVYHVVARENTYHTTMKMFFLIALGLTSLLSLDYLVRLLELLGLRYGNYIDGTLQLMPYQFLYRLPIFLLLILRWQHMKKRDQYTQFYMVMVLYDVLGSQLTSIFAQSGRIGVYFSEYYMLAYPALCMSSKYKGNRKVIGMAIVGYLCIYWWYCYVYSGVDATVPYVSVFD